MGRREVYGVLVAALLLVGACCVALTPGCKGGPSAAELETIAQDTATLASDIATIASGTKAEKLARKLAENLGRAKELAK